MSDLSNYLADAKGTRSIDDIAQRATAAGEPISRSAVAKYLRGEHGPNPPEATLKALAAGFELDVRALRSLAGRASGELDPYIPPQEAASLTRRQREAFDLLIKATAKGDDDAGNAEAEKKREEALALYEAVVRALGPEGPSLTVAALQQQAASWRALPPEERRERVVRILHWRIALNDEREGLGLPPIDFAHMSQAGNVTLEMERAALEAELVEKSPDPADSGDSNITTLTPKHQRMIDDAQMLDQAAYDGEDPEGE